MVWIILSGQIFSRIIRGYVVGESSDRINDKLIRDEFRIIGTGNDTNIFRSYTSEIQ